MHAMHSRKDCHGAEQQGQNPPKWMHSSLSTKVTPQKTITPPRPEGADAKVIGPFVVYARGEHALEGRLLALVEARANVYQSAALRDKLATVHARDTSIMPAMRALERAAMKTPVPCITNNKCILSTDLYDTWVNAPGNDKCVLDFYNRAVRGKYYCVWFQNSQGEWHWATVAAMNGVYLITEYGMVDGLNRFQAEIYATRKLK